MVLDSKFVDIILYLTRYKIFAEACIIMGATVSHLFLSGNLICNVKFSICFFFEIKTYPLCLENISKDFTANNMKKTGLSEYVHEFSVDYNIIDTSNNLDIHKYFMKKYDI